MRLCQKPQFDIFVGKIYFIYFVYNLYFEVQNILLTLQQFSVISFLIEECQSVRASSEGLDLPGCGSLAVTLSHLQKTSFQVIGSFMLWPSDTFISRKRVWVSVNLVI